MGGDAVAGKGMFSFFQGIDTWDSPLLPFLVGSLSSTWQLVGSPSEIMALHVTFKALSIDTVLREFRLFFFS